MTKADLSDANLKAANLEDAHLNAADLRGAFFVGASLKNTNLQGALWDDTTVWPRDFTPPSSREPDVPWWKELKRQPRESLKVLWKKRS